jgi:uncharacterized protein YbaR (Trm112 family)
MRNALLYLLRCPETHSRLKVIIFESKCGPDGTDIRAGLLQSEEGHHFYPIVEGVPVMLPKMVPAPFVTKYADELRRIDGFAEQCVTHSEPDWSFSTEWREFSRYASRRTWGWTVEQRIEMLLLEMRVARESLCRSLVLDAGCGNGMMIDALGSLSTTAVGIDFSTSVFEAEARRRSANTHFVQGDVSNPPFAPE